MMIRYLDPWGLGPGACIGLYNCTGVPGLEVSGLKGVQDFMQGLGSGLLLLCFRAQGFGFWLG